jgi:integrase
MRGSGRIFKPKVRGKDGKRHPIATYTIAYMALRSDGSRGEVRESSHSSDPDVAKKLLKRRLKEAAAAEITGTIFVGPRQQKATVGELLANLERDYRQRQIKGLRRALGRIGDLKERFGHFRALAITPEVLRRFIEEEQGKGLAPATINRSLEILSRAFHLAVQDRKLAPGAIPRIAKLSERGNARTGFFEPAEVASLVAALPDPLGDMAAFGFLSGWRRGEIEQLRWSEVDREAREIVLRDSKNGEGRVLPLGGEDWQLIEKRWAAREFKRKDGSTGLSDLVFHRNGKAVSEKTFWTQWHRATEKAGLPGKLFHDLRRSAVRDLIRGGAPQSVAMAISGHKTTAMFTRYNISSREDKILALAARREYVESRRKNSNVREFRRGAGGGN